MTIFGISIHRIDDKEMEKVVSVSEMVAIEREADLKGLTYGMMMENAGLGLALEIASRYGDIKNRSVLALVGGGNNGGDALVALIRLADMGWRVSAYLVMPRDDNDTLISRYNQTSGQLYSFEMDPQSEILSMLLADGGILLDGIFGTGIRLPLRGPAKSCLKFVKEFINSNKLHVHIVAVDCPSGVDCDNGMVAEETLPADLTVTMAAIKKGMLYWPAADFMGTTVVVRIGDLSTLSAWQKVRRSLVDSSWVRNHLPSRPRNAHKGTFGTALIVAGSVNYTGAALLAGKAACRIGAGLVQLAIPSVLHVAISGHLPEVIWLPLPHESGGISEDAIKEINNNPVKSTVMLIGPGLGLRLTTQNFVHALLGQHENVPDLKGLVIDADGLKLLSSLPEWYKRLSKIAILTPHPGEMSYLTGLPIERIQADRIGIAETFAQEWKHIVVLKGANTVVASPEGSSMIIPIATSALSKAGTGDVLAGIAIGLLAQGIPSFEAAVMSAWIHGAAGITAEEKFGATSILASDLLDLVGETIRNLS